MFKTKHLPDSSSDLTESSLRCWDGSRSKRRSSEEIVRASKRLLLAMVLYLQIRVTVRRLIGWISNKQQGAQRAG